jgi:hypothetical protein
MASKTKFSIYEGKESMISVEIDPKQIEKIMEIPVEAGKKAFTYLALEVWGGMRKESPVDHGRLAGSWQLEKRGDFEARIVSGVEYAPYVAFGTGLYGPNKQAIVITPVQAKCLHFIWQGEEIFAKKVVVEGMHPNPYHERAMEKGESRVDEFIARALRETEKGV